MVFLHYTWTWTLCPILNLSNKGAKNMKKGGIKEEKVEEENNSRVK